MSHRPRSQSDCNCMPGDPDNPHTFQTHIEMHLESSPQDHTCMQSHTCIRHKKSHRHRTPRIGQPRSIHRNCMSLQDNRYNHKDRWHQDHYKSHMHQQCLCNHRHRHKHHRCLDRTRMSHHKFREHQRPLPHNCTNRCLQGKNRSRPPAMPQHQSCMPQNLYNQDKQTHSYCRQ